MIDAGADPRRPLVITTTGEPMQPVRLYYRVAAGKRPAVVRILAGIKCVERAPVGPPRWGWWHEKEAARLDFSELADSAQPSAEPIVLGVLDLRPPDELTITVRSLHRAVLATQFFGKRLGERVHLERVRVLNRLLTGDDLGGGIDAVDDLLDDVTAGEGGEPEARRAHVVERLRSERGLTLEELDVIAAELRDDAEADVPLVEDLAIDRDLEARWHPSSASS